MNEEFFKNDPAYSLIDQFINEAKTGKPAPGGLMESFNSAFKQMETACDTYSAALFRLGEFARKLDQSEKNYMKLVKENSELAQECAELQDRNKMLEKKCIELARKLSDTVDYRLKKWFGAK